MKNKTLPPILMLAAAVLFVPVTAFAQTQAPEPLSLRSALELALEGNPALRSADALRSAAESRVWETRSGHLPQISLHAGYSWYQEPNIVFPIHKAGVFPPLDDRIFESGVQASLPLFSGGKISRRTEAAKAGVSQAAARSALARQDLMQQIALLYLGAAETADRRSLLSARLEDLRTRREELRTLAGEGRVSSAQIALIDAQTASVRADSLQAAQASDEIALRLGQLTGLGVAVRPETQSDRIRLSESLPPLGAASVSAVEANSEWQLAQAQKRQAEAEASFASRAFWPDLSGFAAYNYRSGGSNWDPAGEWVAGLRLSLPLLDGGRSIAALSTTEASVRAADEHLRSVGQRARIDHEVAVASFHSALARTSALEEAARQKGLFVAAQRSLYAEGRLALGELETQETELLQLGLQAKGMRYEALRSAIAAARSAGTLTKDYLLMISGDETR